MSKRHTGQQISEKRTGELLDDLKGYADGEHKVKRATGMNSEALKDWALNYNVEKCPSCGWWVDTHELLPGESFDPDGHCDNCRGSEE